MKTLPPPTVAHSTAQACASVLLANCARGSLSADARWLGGGFLSPVVARSARSFGQRGSNSEFKALARRASLLCGRTPHKRPVADETGSTLLPIKVLKTGRLSDRVVPVPAPLRRGVVFTLSVDCHLLMQPVAAHGTNLRLSACRGQKGAATTARRYSVRCVGGRPFRPR
jgi:hypothetical protein